MTNHNNIIEGKYWYFYQNNSGGYITPPAANVIVRADTAEEAETLLRKQEGYTDTYCECCGPRWYSPEAMTVEEARAELKKLNDPADWRNKERDGLPPYVVLGIPDMPTEMSDNERRLRAVIKNSDGWSPERDALGDLLEEQGRLGELPVTPATWVAHMRLLEDRGRYQKWKPLTLWNGWKLSIQASEAHYCEPRISSKDARDYSSWELAVFYPNGDWVDADDDVPGLRRLLPNYEAGGSAVCGHVRVEEIERLINHLAATEPPPEKRGN